MCVRSGNNGPRQYQLIFELRPAHDPTKAYGFVGMALCLEDLSASIWLWHRDGEKWAIKNVFTIPAEPTEPDQLPPMLEGFSAVPPLSANITETPATFGISVGRWR